MLPNFSCILYKSDTADDLQRPYYIHCRHDKLYLLYTTDADNEGKVISHMSVWNKCQTRAKHPACDLSSRHGQVDEAFSSARRETTEGRGKESAFSHDFIVN